jgi:hypothetical protein
MNPRRNHTNRQRDERNCRRVDALGGADLAKQLACSTT